MQPLAALLGVVMGSSLALLAGLSMTLAVFLLLPVLLPEFHDRVASEYAPLLRAVAWAALLTTISATAFVGQLKTKPWRLPAQLGLVITAGVVAWNYWPA